MRRYFQRLENCRHRPVYRWLAKLGIDPTHHGWAGWLHTERADIRPIFRDRALAKVMKRSARRALREVGAADHPPVVAASGQGRPQRLAPGAAERGGHRLPARSPRATTRGQGRGSGSSTSLGGIPDRLRVELDALATRVLLDAENRAVGVEYLAGARLYRAHRQPSGAAGERREVRASMEVILAGGAFNTPQLLMLSGIGPREATGAPRHRGPRGAPRRGPEPPGPLRDRRGEPDGLRALEGAGGGPVREGRSPAPGVGEPAARSVREQRRDPRGERALGAGARPSRTSTASACWRSSRATTPDTPRPSPSASTTSRGRSSRPTPATARGR